MCLKIQQVISWMFVGNQKRKRLKSSNRSNKFYDGTMIMLAFWQQSRIRYRQIIPTIPEMKMKIKRITI